MRAGLPSLRVPIPRRSDPLAPPARAPAIVVSSVVHRLRRGFFVLLQSELGDIFKVSIDCAPADAAAPAAAAPAAAAPAAANIRISYFDTIPVAASLCLLKSGFLFAASELGNHCFYHVVGLGDDDALQPVFQSRDFPQLADVHPEVDHSLYSRALFSPRHLTNLAPIDIFESACPLIDAKVLNLTDEDSPQIYALSGRGASSSLRILRHGLDVAELAVSELPGVPNAVWSVRASASVPFDAFIVISFVNATLVLSIGDSVEEVTDTGLLANTPTICAALLGDDALVQVYPLGIRYIRADRRVSEWRAPGNRSIMRAACSDRQVAIALAGGELVYFELDASGHLNEFQDRRSMPAAVTALAFSPVPEGRLRALFLCVGCDDNTVRMLSLDPESCLLPLGVQALGATPESLVLAELTDPTTGIVSLSLNTGLQNGVLLRTAVDTVTGALSDTRLRFLGARPVKLFPMQIQGSPAVLALSSRPWLLFNHQSRSKLTPLSYEPLEYGSRFCTDQCPEGFVAISGNTLRILNVEKLGNVFNQVSIPLKYTPRRFIMDETSKNFVIIESEHGTPCPSERAKRLEEHAKTQSINDESVLEELPVEQFGLPKSKPGTWASCIRIVNALQGETVFMEDFDNNEAAFSITACVFASSPMATHIIIGTAVGVMLAPKSHKAAFLRVYKLSPDGTALELVHKTPVEEIPRALTPFQGQLLVGLGRYLRIYDLGKKKLLRKCECKALPNMVVTLHTSENRIIASDVQESVHYALYREFDNRIVVFADDVRPMWTTCTALLDHDTVAVGDKFGNISIIRVSDTTSREVDEDRTGNLAVFDRGILQGAPYKLTHEADFYISETVTSITKTTLVPGGRQVILYTTLFGTIGILIPFISKQDIDFYQTLEMSLRSESPPISGRDHLAYRSMYVPVRNVIDGDFCDVFGDIGMEKKRVVAEGLDRSVGEVSKKLEDIRNRVAF